MSSCALWCTSAASSVQGGTSEFAEDITSGRVSPSSAPTLLAALLSFGAHRAEVEARQKPLSSHVVAALPCAEEVHSFANSVNKHQLISHQSKNSGEQITPQGHYQVGQIAVKKEGSEAIAAEEGKTMPTAQSRRRTWRESVTAPFVSAGGGFRHVRSCPLGAGGGARRSSAAPMSLAQAQVLEESTRLAMQLAEEDAETEVPEAIRRLAAVRASWQEARRWLQEFEGRSLDESEDLEDGIVDGSPSKRWA